MKGTASGPALDKPDECEVEQALLTITDYIGDEERGVTEVTGGDCLVLWGESIFELEGYVILFVA